MFKLPSSYSLADVILIESLTHLHVGSGKVSGLVDLPVQRDEYGLPCIFSSSLKGALKTALLYAATKMHNNYENASKLIASILGPEPEPEESFESSVALLDAYLLAMPARSLKGVYAYVTIPLLLRKFSEFLDLVMSTRGEKEAGRKGCEQKEIHDAGASDRLTLKKIKESIDSIIRITENLQEESFICLDGGKNLCRSVQIEELNNQVVLVEDITLSSASGTQDRIDALLDSLGITERPLLILNDTVGEEVINRSLLTLAHVRLKRGTKTVDEGPWTTEYVPAKAKFFTVALYKRPYISQKLLNEPVEERYKEVLKTLGFSEKHLQEGKYAEATREIFRRLIQQQLLGYLIVGGRETVGKGIVKLRFLDW